MPKKSNKTEHVLNLISKNDEAIDQEDLQAEEEVTTVEQNPLITAAEVEIKLKAEEEEKELKIERKLKIELEPQIGIKPAAEDEPELLVQIPQETIEEKPAQPVAPKIQEVDEASWPHLPPEEKRVYLVNLSEKLALEMVDEVMERLNVCTCPICKNDILALALNSLTHNYVTTDAGRQYMLLEVYRKQYETDVVAALTKACVRVKAAPKH